MNKRAAKRLRKFHAAFEAAGAVGSLATLKREYERAPRTKRSEMNRQMETASAIARQY